MRKLTLVGIVLAVAALGAVALVACGGGYDDNGDGGAVATQPSGAVTTLAGNGPTAPSGGGSDEVTVTATDFAFSPDGVEVTSSGDVTFTLENDGSASHTLTLYSDADFNMPIDSADTGIVSAGGSGGFTLAFDAPGEAFFRCEVHPSQMQGSIAIN
jgi:plastocyanin